MSAMVGNVPLSGSVEIKKVKTVKRAPLSWRIQNALRWSFIKGWIAKHAIVPLANAWGVMCGIAELKLTKILRDGSRVEYGVVGYRVVTTAGVNYIVDDFDNGSGGADVSLFNFHGVGTGNTAEAIGDTALVTESTTALNPDSTRATGTRTQPTANQFRSTGTLTFDASAAIVEHGLFTQAATGGGTLLDRTVFSVVNMASGESLQCEYTITFTAGS